MTLIELAKSIQDATFKLNAIGVKDSPAVRERLTGTNDFICAYLKGTEEANRDTATVGDNDR